MTHPEARERYNCIVEIDADLFEEFYGVLKLANFIKHEKLFGMVMLHGAHKPIPKSVYENKKGVLVLGTCTSILGTHCIDQQIKLGFSPAGFWDKVILTITPEGSETMNDDDLWKFNERMDRLLNKYT